MEIPLYARFIASSAAHATVSPQSHDIIKGVSDTYGAYFWGIPLIVLSITLGGWFNFKSADNSTDKKKWANIILLIGSLLTVLILIILGFVFDIYSQLLKNLLILINLPVTVGGLVGLILVYMIAAYILRLIKRFIFRNEGKVLFMDRMDKDLEQWSPISGKPIISSERGKNRVKKSLLLDKDSSSRRNTCLLVKMNNIKNAIIECDVYLEPNAVFNIVFRSNLGVSNYYMARLDSRPRGGLNGFWIGERVDSWRHLTSKSKVLHGKWCHVILNVRDSHFILDIDGETLEADDNTYTSAGGIGMFNEINRVFVNNFTVTSLSNC